MKKKYEEMSEGFGWEGRREIILEKASATKKSWVGSKRSRSQASTLDLRFA